MTLWRIPPRRIAWLILWIVGLAALAPSVSRTLALAGQPGWVEVCSADGLRWVRVADGSAAREPSAPADAPRLDHCPLCVLMGERLAPAPTPFALAPPAHAHRLPAAVRLAPPPHRFSIAAAPRGPPARSAAAFVA